MEIINIKGQAGVVSFVPARISHARILEIEKGLKKLIGFSADDLTASDMRALLKKRDPLIGTSGGTIRAYRTREELTQHDLAKKAKIRQGHLSEMEQNKRPIGVKVAKKLAKVLRCDYRRLL